MQRGWLRKDVFTLRLPAVRFLSLLALIGYPVGLLLEVRHDNLGSLLIVPSALAIAVLLLSRSDRLFVDGGELDEFERSQSAKALRYTYWIFVLLALVFWMAARLGTVTISDDIAEKLGFALFTWLLILPVAIQAWWLRHPFDREEKSGTEAEEV